MLNQVPPPLLRVQFTLHILVMGDEVGDLIKNKKNALKPPQFLLQTSALRSPSSVLLYGL